MTSARLFIESEKLSQAVDEKRKKGKEEYLDSAFILRFSLKALRHGSHSFTCKLHHACLSFVSVHQMAPSLNVVANI